MCSSLHSVGFKHRVSSGIIIFDQKERKVKSLHSRLISVTKTMTGRTDKLLILLLNKSSRQKLHEEFQLLNTFLRQTEIVTVTCSFIKVVLISSQWDNVQPSFL